MRRRWLWSGILGAMIALGLMMCSQNAFAEGANRMTIVIDPKRLQSEWREDLSKVTYYLWKVEDKTGEDAMALQARLDKKSLEELNRIYEGLVPVAKTISAEEKEHVIEGLADGLYYVRGIIEGGEKEIATFLVAFPYLSMEGVYKKEVEVSPKLGIAITIPTPKNPSGGEKFIKVDNDTQKPLEHAVFKIMTRVDDREGERGAVESAHYLPVHQKRKELLLRSGSDGRFEVTDLPHGTYYLVETVPPAGYLALEAPFAFVVDGTSYDDGKVIKILNKKHPAPIGKDVGRFNPKVTIPKTGDTTFIASMIAGGLCILGGAFLMRVENRSDDEMRAD